jgi:hypothetical protein
MFGELPKEFLTPLENFGKLWKRMTTLNTRHDPGIGHQWNQEAPITHWSARVGHVDRKI